MKAIRVSVFGGPEVLEWVDAPVPSPGPGMALVRLAAIGINYIDVYQRIGLYPLSLPFTVGSEGAGTVEAVGPGVTSLADGDRVAYAMVPGAYAEYAVVPAARLVRIPDPIDFRSAAALMLQGMTAHYLCNSTFPLEGGQMALVHAGAGGVGLLLTQLAKAKGAIVITTVSTAEKEVLSREAGADHVIRYTETDFESEVRRISNGTGVDVVYDSVGASTFDQSLLCLRPRGMMVLFGQSSGRVAPFDLQTLNTRGSLFVTRPTLRDYTATRAELLERAGDVLGGIARGDLRVRIDRTMPLAQAAAAHRALEARETSGKILLVT